MTNEAPELHSPYHDGSMQVDKDGGWVSAEDYADLSDDKDKRIEELEAERDELTERVDELQQACEVVSSEFEGELWQSCRRLLQKTQFDFHGAEVDGVQAGDFENHMNETLVEFHRAEARIAELEAQQAKDWENINLKADFIDKCLNDIATDSQRIDELEAKLAKAVAVLERIAHASDVYGVEANAEDQGADTLAYAHKSTCNLARATIEELKGTESPLTVD